MATHYKFYDGLDETVVPWNARYSFPSQSNKAQKITSRITPSTGSQAYSPGNVIRINIPAQGYLNTLNTTLEFDVTILGPITPGNSITKFENNIYSLFSRGRLLYGSNPIEDIINIGTIIRAVGEWTDGGSTLDQDSIANGLGTVSFAAAATTGGFGLVNTRPSYIQGQDASTAGFGLVPNASQGTLSLPGGRTYCTRTYQINLAFGMFLQSKLLPMKWMANQFQLEFTLAPPQNCMMVIPSFTTGGSSGTPKTSSDDPTYQLSNVTLITEIIEFDASYDVAFLRGLTTGGVPIKYTSWHNYTFPMSGSKLQLIIQEKSRSIKSIFAMVQRSPASIYADSNASFFSTVDDTALVNFQFRAGSRYYPSAPVQCAYGFTNVNNGGCEAFVELQKALNTLGDSRVKTSMNTLRWATPWNDTIANVPTLYSNVAIANPILSGNELDYGVYVTGFAADGKPTFSTAQYSSSATGWALPTSGNVGSTMFAMATDFETSNGIEIAGLSGEEQNDIALNVTYNASQVPTFDVQVFTHFDGLFVLRENNVAQNIL